EITGIIDKMQGSGGKTVSLVLPKRAAVFQSIVNMKLLKRAADGAGKELVLVTSEAGLLPLAGVAGIKVAKTMNSTPEVPKAPKLAEEAEETVKEKAADAAGEVTAATAGNKPVGELAGRPPADGAMETLTLDESKLPQESTTKGSKPKSFEPAAAAGAAAAKSKAKKNKKLKIPNFNRFRLLVVCGLLLLVLLIVGGILALKVLPKATITLHTDAQKIDSNLTLNLSTSAQSLDPSSFTVPAKLVQQQKTYSQSVATTGQTNNGNKATGAVIMTAQECGQNLDPPATVPAGTGVSSNGQTYITRNNTTFSNLGKGHHDCVTYQANSATNIIAQNGGSSYNGATSFTVPSRSDISSVKVTSQVSGGTDKIVKSVNQNDLNNAKSKINVNDPTVKQALEDQLKQNGYFAIVSTYTASTPQVSNSANVGDVADNVTVTETVNYTMFGAHKSDLKMLVDNDVSSQIDTSKQKVQDEGLDQATFNVVSATSSGAQIVMDTKAIAGPDINVANIQKTSEGLKSGQVKSSLENNPNIKSVDVNLSPFWVSTVPKNTSKIKVVIAEPKTVSKNNANSQ
ncbi:MAG: hypothetical protein ACREJM_13835, partial [Candidatus Saccharimonadales bacterium]